MREMETLLDPRLFQRVHRSTLVNLRRVKSRGTLLGDVVAGEAGVEYVE